MLVTLLKSVKYVHFEIYVTEAGPRWMWSHTQSFLDLVSASLLHSYILLIFNGGFIIEHCQRCILVIFELI